MEILVRDGGPPVAAVARHKGRLVEIAADDSAVNDSSDTLGSLDSSGDGSDDRGDADRDAA